MKKNALPAGMVLVAVFFTACAAAKPPVMQNGRQVEISVVCDRGLTQDMPEDERNDRIEVGAFLEEDLLKTLQAEGYKTRLIPNRYRYVYSPASYLVIVRIDHVRLVGKETHKLMGPLTGPTLLKVHYELSGLGDRLNYSFDDKDATIRDWMNAPRELNRRLVERITVSLTR